VLDLRGRHRDALAHAEQAHDLYRSAGHPVGQANALNSIGWSHTLIGEYGAGDVDGARIAWRQALAILNHLNHPDTAEIIAKLRQIDDEAAGNPSGR
jgi:hypothetical protein